MSYGVHIERRTAPTSESTITLKEWHAYIESSPDLEIIDAWEQTNSLTGEVIHIPGDGIAVWNGLGDREAVYFNYGIGRISTGNPNNRIIAKMKEIAQALDARVIGDEGEEY